LRVANRAPILIQAHGRAINRPSRNEADKLVRCLRAALILQALIVATKLTAFGRIYGSIHLITLECDRPQ
jgi:hypothetical protein